MSREPLTPEDRAFAEELSNKYYGLIKRIAKRRIKSDPAIELEDVIQDVYLMICKQVADFRETDTPEALIWTMTTRRVDWLRKTAPRHEPLSENASASDAPDLGIEEYYTDDMSDFDKFLLDEVYTKQETIADVARDIDMPAPRLRQRLKRARDKLKNVIEEDEDEENEEDK